MVLTLDVWSVQDLLGEPTVVQSIAALEGGAVLVAGHFGLLRTRDDGQSWERVSSPPELLSSSFLQLQPAAGGAAYAVAFGEVGWSSSSGTDWTVMYTGDSNVMQLHHLPSSEVYVLGGDNVIGLLAPPLGAIDWHSIEALNGDRDSYFENNTVYGVVWTLGGYYVAAERMGRVARARAPDGPWEQLHLSIGGDPELLYVPGVGILSRVAAGDVAVSCDDGVTFWPLGDSGEFASAGAGAHQLAVTDDQVLVAPGQESIALSCDMGQSFSHYSPSVEWGRAVAARDVSVAPDGAVWVSGQSHVFRLSW